MRTLPAVLIVVAIVLLASPGVRAEADVSGPWMFTFTNPQAPTISVRATLRQRGDRVTGSIELPAGTVETDGNHKAGEVTLSFVYPDFESGASITATLIGKLEGDELKGVIDYQTFGSGEWKGRRAPRPATEASEKRGQPWRRARHVRIMSAARHRVPGVRPFLENFAHLGARGSAEVY